MRTNRIANAAVATEVADRAIDEARNLLVLDRRINSLGIYIDVQAVRSNIEAAKTCLETAANSLAREWPGPADYHEV